MIAVTGATGQLGRIVVEKLKDRVDPSQIIAAVRNPAKAQDLGVEVRLADYTRPETLEKAFEGVSRLLLISSPLIGQRFGHHKAAIEAARKAGVGFIAYTSLTRADSNPMKLASEHRETEAYLRQAGIPFAVLRNGWYMENYAPQIPAAFEHGVVVGCAGEGRISAATRADYADAAAVVMTTDGHEGKIYELAGDEAFTMDEFAAELSRQSGKQIKYQDLPESEYADMLSGTGMPKEAAAVLADSDRQIAEGHLYVDSGDLSRLTGSSTTSLSEAVSEMLSASEPIAS